MDYSREALVKSLADTGILEDLAREFLIACERIRALEITLDHAIAQMEEVGWPVKQAETLMTAFRNICRDRGIVVREADWSSPPPIAPSEPSSRLRIGPRHGLHLD